jgi:hypothetical protein
MGMHIDRFEFQFVCYLEPEIGSEGAAVPLMPQHRYANAKNLPINPYGVGPFCKFRIPRHFNTRGVYALVVEGSIKYIGECINLSSRYNSGYGNISPRNCFKGGQETNCRLNARIYAEALCGRRVELWFHATGEHKRLENHLLAFSSYEWNRGAIRIP